MKINFTGLQNLSYIRNPRPPKSVSDHSERILNMELVGGDKNGFLNALEKSQLDDKFINKLHPDFVKIRYLKYPHDNSIQVGLNDWQLKLEEKNIPMLIFLEKVTKKICLCEDVLPMNLKYKNSDLPDNALMHHSLSDFLKISKEECFLKTHDINKIKAGAKIINNLFKNLLDDYFLN